MVVLFVSYTFLIVETMHWTASCSEFCINRFFLFLCFQERIFDHGVFGHIWDSIQTNLPDNKRKSTLLMAVVDAFNRYLKSQYGRMFGRSLSHELVERGIIADERNREDFLSSRNTSADLLNNSEQRASQWMQANLHAETQIDVAKINMLGEFAASLSNVFCR